MVSLSLSPWRHWCRKCQTSLSLSLCVSLCVCLCLPPPPDISLFYFLTKTPTLGIETHPCRTAFVTFQCVSSLLFLKSSMAPRRLSLVAHCLVACASRLDLSHCCTYQLFGTTDQVRRKTSTRQGQADTTAAPTINTPRALSGVPLSAGTDHRENSSGNHDRETIWSPQLEGWRQREAQQQPPQQHHQRTERRQRKQWNPTAAPGGENSGQHRPARRPSSAAGRAWSFDVAGPLARAAGNRTRLSAGRAVSTSCSPVRLRRSSTSTTVRPARGEGRTERGSVVGTEVGRFGNGDGSGGSCIGGGGGNCRVAFARRKTKVSGQGVVDRGAGSERLLGGNGFFSPSRDGRRIRLLK